MEIREFIEKEKNDMLFTYRNKQTRIEQDYNRERRTISDYKGRELLELLQNADDALDNQCNVKVFFDGKQLIVSNDGIPFSKEGIVSLMYSDVSPKMKNSIETIGCKGLGFRSILSWAEEIKIDSGDLHIEFSDEIAQTQLKQGLLDRYKNTLKAATLALPKWNDYPSKNDYVTAISIKIKDDEEIKKDINNQIEKLKPETLLFLNKTKTLEINNSEKNTIIERKDIDDENITISVRINGKLSRETQWVIVKEPGTIDDNKQYIISFAYRKDGKPARNNPIYSFFPTREDFPYPILFNASFELSSNRNTIELNNKLNKIIFSKSAKLLVDTAIKMHEGKADYKILWFLLSNMDFSPNSPFENYNFQSTLLDEINKREVFPNVNKEYIKHSKSTIKGKYGISRYITGKQFNNVLMHFDESVISKFYNEDDLEQKYRIFENRISKFEFEDFELNVLFNKVSEWVETLKYQSKSDMSHLAKTLISLYTYKRFRYSWGTSKKCFLYNDQGEILDINTCSYIKDEESITNPPAFNDFNLVANNLAISLQKELRDEENKDDADEILKWLNIYHFNIVDIVENNNSVILDMSYDDKEKAQQLAFEQLKWLWENKKHLYKLENNLTVVVPTKDGDVNDSDDRYYGSDYGNEFIEKLFPDSPELMICQLEGHIGKGNKREDILKFLDKLGVSSEPKITIKEHELRYLGSNYDNTYYNSLLGNIDFSTPFRIKGTSQEYKTIEEARQHIWFRLKTTRIDRLDDIFEYAKARDIIDWISKNKQLQSILFDRHEENAPGKVQYFYDNNKNSPREDSRFNKHISELFLRFSNKEWIEHNDMVYAPKECLLNNDYIDLFNVEQVACVSIDDYKRDNDSKKEIENIKFVLKQLGATDRIDMLPSSTVYDMLINLKEKDPEGKYASSIYEKLIRSETFYKNIKNEKNYKEFIKNGYVLTNHGYQKLTESNYEGKKKLCKGIEDIYNFISIDGSRGISRERIKKIFELEKPDTKVNIKDRTENKIIQDSFAADFKSFKYFVYSYKYSDVQNIDDAKKLFNLNVVLCDMVAGTHKGKNIILEDYEYIKDGRNTYLLKVPSLIQPSSYKNDYHFAESISSIVCEHLDMEEDEIEDTISILYSRDAIGRREKLEKDFNKDVYNQARKVLNGFYGTKYDFHEILKTISKENESIYLSYLDKINFEDFDDPESIKAIIECFKHAKIDIEDYNKENPEVKLDLTRYYLKQIKNKLHNYETKYKTKCYFELLDTQIEQKEHLCERFDMFNEIDYGVCNSVYFDIDAEIVKTLQISSINKIVDVDELYKNNSNNWILSLNNKEFVNDFLNDYSNHSLMIYNETKELDRRYNVLLNEHKQKEETSQDFDFKANIPTNLGIGKITKSSEKNISKDKDHKQKRVSYGFKKQDLAQDSREEIGALGEKYVYEELLKEYKYVKWKSENSPNPDGTAGLGYDIEYADENGNLKYVEVKTTKRKNGNMEFFMSETEYNFAIEHFDSFSIWYVFLSGEEIRIRKFDNLFSADGAIKELNEKKEIKYLFSVAIDE